MKPTKLVPAWGWGVRSDGKPNYWYIVSVQGIYIVSNNDVEAL